MIKESKYIIRRIIIGVGVALCLMFIQSCDVHAITTDNNVYINNTLMTSGVKKYSGGAENINVSIRPTSSSQVNYDAPQYGYVAVCSAFGSYENRYINTVSSNQVGELAVVNSTVGCTIPTTSAYRLTARVVYITYKIPYSYYDCGSGSGVCAWKGNVNLAWYQPASNEFSLISYGFNTEPYNFNDTTDPKVIQNDTIISQNDTQINQNNTIINQNTEINDNIKDTNDTMKDDSVSSPYSSINEAKNSVATNGVITQLVTLPVTLFQKILNSVNGSCSSYNMGSLLGTDIILPCINVSNYIGSTLWSVIDVLISGLFVWSISRKMIKVFNNFSTLKDGDVLGD